MHEERELLTEFCEWSGALPTAFIDRLVEDFLREKYEDGDFMGDIANYNILVDYARWRSNE